MIVRPCVQNVPGTISEACPVGYTLEKQPRGQQVTSFYKGVHFLFGKVEVLHQILNLHQTCIVKCAHFCSNIETCSIIASLLVIKHLLDTFPPVTCVPAVSYELGVNY